MDKKDMARLLGFTRIFIGAFIFLFPGLSTRLLGGRAADTGPTRMTMRGVGGRDVAIGLGIVLSVENDEKPTGWLAASAAADASDAIGTLMNGSDVPTPLRLALFATEAGAAVIGLQLATSDEL